MNYGIEFALTRSYDRFNRKWRLPSEKTAWVKVWCLYLNDCSLDEITAVTDYCESEMNRAPSLPEFAQLVDRLRSGKPLSDPIVSLAERMAFLILTSDEFADADAPTLSDACLIAGALAHLKSYGGIGDVSGEEIASDFSGRAKMFSCAAGHWKTDVDQGKGYWKFYFAEQANDV
ncbi:MULTISPECIES: hypothetical protein [unclassified Lysobacter]|uniref:hypothetical protein n=1 Tax=unclassified Lysobacter TaxID=2635362 RepID=UPI001BEBCD64|nr:MULTISPECIES: hypothetical protein [unclassified Lysobacter]MBT2750039.1 hypothetical protein [Lysobacter sp. ISL-50]MBT2775389.1 hypothetical protein [Lysobacter sp. ISL-54]MBT2783512.1 hypothetical protein [Lysobacter sp. ISL-52]